VERHEVSFLSLLLFLELFLCSGFAASFLDFNFAASFFTSASFLDSGFSFFLLSALV